MNCPKCGAENADTSNFCTSCGAPLAAAGNAGSLQDDAFGAQSAAGPAQGAANTSPGFGASGASANAGFTANGAPVDQAPQNNQYMPPNPAQAYSITRARSSVEKVIE